MDVSGSMDEARKGPGQTLLHPAVPVFTRHYEKIDIVFIRHHTQAAEVSEDEFFHSTESGGTVVSSALVLLDQIMRGATLAGLEHLRCPGQRRRQLHQRQRQPPQPAGGEDPAPGALLCLCAGWRRRSKTCGRSTASSPAVPAVRDAQGVRARGDLPVLRDPFKKEGVGMNLSHSGRPGAPHRFAPWQGAPFSGWRGRAALPAASGQASDAPLPDPSDWTFELIERYHAAIAATAERYGLDTIPNQLEVISAEQMMDAYASVGMPVGYRHWSYGKEFPGHRAALPARPHGAGVRDRHQLNPRICYLMEENTTAMQAW